MKVKKANIDYRVLVVSVLLAVILWSWVTLTRDYTYTIAMPLVVSEIPDDQVLSKKLPDSVLVKLDGSGRSYFQLYLYNPKFRLNLSGIRKSQQIELRRRIDEVDFPSGIPIKIVEIVSPKYIQVEFSKKSTKKLPVSANISFSLEPGYIWVTTKLTPDSVSLDGPRTIIRELSDLQTKRIEFTKPLMRPVEQLVSIDMPEESNIIISPEKVKLMVDIQRLAENQLSNIPVKIINIPGNRTASSIPANVSIKLKGGDKILAGITKENVNAYIDYEIDFDRQQKLYRVNFNITENVEIISYEPKFFEILIRENE